MLVNRIPYTKFEGRYRPYLLTIFKKEKNFTPATFALVDSGADHTVIPFSLGKHIGLESPSQNEIFQNANGVGGQISYLKRDCEICIGDFTNKQIYFFSEKVYWIYPDQNTQDYQNKLGNDYKEMEEFKRQCKTGTKLENYFEEQMKLIANEIISINNKFETGVLIGRPFLNNFEFIQFCQKDRDQENTCFFNFKVSDSKIINTIPLPDLSKSVIKNQK